MIGSGASKADIIAADASGIIVTRLFERVDVAVGTGGKINVLIAQQPDGRDINREVVSKFGQDGLQGLIETDIIGKETRHFAQAVGHTATPLFGADTGQSCGWQRRCYRPRLQRSTDRLL